MAVIYQCDVCSLKETVRRTWNSLYKMKAFRYIKPLKSSGHPHVYYALACEGKCEETLRESIKVPFAILHWTGDWRNEDGSFA